MKRVGKIANWKQFITESTTTVFSDQVFRQLQHLKSLGSNGRSFTIVDTQNGIVWAFNSDFSVHSKYPVLVGSDTGEDLKLETFKDYIIKTKGDGSYFKAIINFFSDVIDFRKIPGWIFGGSEPLDRKKLDILVDDFFEPWIKGKKLTTPSGVFRRRGAVVDTINNLFLTLQNKIYGKRYITWETLKWSGWQGEDGKEIPHGFHGTEEDDKIDFTKQEWIEMCKLKNMKMSFGCVLFREKDILDINDFIDYGDMSFWLSSLSDRIFELEQEDWHK